MSGHGDLSARILAGEAPAAIKLAAARGALPLPPGEVLRLQVHLRQDEDPAVRAAAEENLGRLAPRLLESVVDDPASAPELVGYLLVERTDLAASLRAALVTHPAAGGSLLERVAREEKAPEVLDALLSNQRQLLETPAIVDALKGNAALTPDHHRRLGDLLDHLLRKERPAAPAETPAALEPAKDPRLAAVGVDAEVEAMLPLLDIDVGELLSASEIQGGDEFADDDEHAGTYERILNMNVGQKLRLALFGTREERNILVRDTNKMIAVGVVKNPRMTEDELEQISLSRNVCEEVLLQVSRRKEAMKRYSVAHNLVRNPRTPTGVAINLVSRLRDNDLRLLTTDRNVTELVRSTARKQMFARQQRQKVVSFRKGH